jgi:hypothetical protein
MFGKEVLLFSVLMRACDAASVRFSGSLHYNGKKVFSSKQSANIHKKTKCKR